MAEKEREHSTISIQTKVAHEVDIYKAYVRVCCVCVRRYVSSHCCGSNTAAIKVLKWALMLSILLYIVGL